MLLQCCKKKNKNAPQAQGGQVNRGFVQGNRKPGDLEAQMSLEGRRGGNREMEVGQMRAPGVMVGDIDSSRENLRKADGFMDLTIDPTLNVSCLTMFLQNK